MDRVIEYSATLVACPIPRGSHAVRRGTSLGRLFLVREGSVYQDGSLVCAGARLPRRRTGDSNEMK